MKDINYIAGLILSGIIILTAIIAYIVEKRKLKNLNKEIKEEKDKFESNWLNEVRRKYLFEIQDKTDELDSIKEKIKEKENEIIKIEKEINKKKEFNSSLLKMREEELNRLIEEKRLRRERELEFEIEEWAQSAQEAATYQRDQIFKNLQVEIDEKDEELRNLQMEVNEFRSKRNAINEEIMRARAIEENQDFYRIQLSKESWEDVHYLLSITVNFNHKDIIYKLIWSEYIQQPFKLMLNRVLKNKDPRNVIYMIQNLKTKEIYIGKTKAEVSKRWTEHIKTSLNIGTISHSNIHNALFNNWDNFSFSVLEEVDSKENLNSREKYYIDFYKSNIYGYNIKSGG